MPYNLTYKPSSRSYHFSQSLLANIYTSTSSDLGYKPSS